MKENEKESHNFWHQQPYTMFNGQVGFSTQDKKVYLILNM